MNPLKLFAELKRKCGTSTDAQLAAALGITPVHFYRLRSKRALSVKEVARLISRIQKRLVSGPAITGALQRRLSAKNTNQLCKRLRIPQSNLNHWLGGELDADKLAGFVKTVRSKAIGEVLKYPLKPIAEYYPINAPRKKGRSSILSAKIPRELGLRKSLEAANGVYIFYNSQAEAIYVGKANEMNLWKEMNNAFNRSRDAQTVRLVQHPKRGSKFIPAFERSRRIQRSNVYLHEISHFFSAYQAEMEMIDNLEAMLIRAFANSLTNDRMEKFHT